MMIGVIDLKKHMGLLLLLLCVCTGRVFAVAPTISSETAIVIDADTGKVLYDKSADSLMLPASMSKLMTVYLLMEELEAGGIAYDTQLLVTEEHEYLSSGQIYFPGYAITLREGNYETVETLLHLIFQQSASTPCLMLAEAISGTEEAFVERMNDTARRMGLDVWYDNCHGVTGNYITARSQAKLAQLLLWQYPQVLDYASQPTFVHRGVTYGVITQLVNPNSKYYMEEVTGLKIGGTSTSKTCLTTTVDREGASLIIVTMKANTSALCYTDHTNLIEYGFGLLLGQDYLPFHDVTEEGMTGAYGAFLEKGVLLQSSNGWVRPYDAVTVGEFAVSFVSALEKLGLLEQVATADFTAWQDLLSYCHKDLVYRGISGNVLPEVEGDWYGVDEYMTQGSIWEIFSTVDALLGGKSVDYTVLGAGEELLSRQEALEWMLLYFQSYGFFSEYDDSEELRTVSLWAEDIVSNAEQSGWVPEGFSLDYTTAIQRVEIVELLVDLVEYYSGELPWVASEFTDTDSLAVAQAVALGFVGGRSPTEFDPSAFATRQELALLFTGCIAVIEERTDLHLLEQGVSPEGYVDMGEVASWAVAPVVYVLQYGVMSGMAQDAFFPLYTSTIEQCIAMVSLLREESRWG